MTCTHAHIYMKSMTTNGRSKAWNCGRKQMFTMKIVRSEPRSDMANPSRLILTASWRLCFRKVVIFKIFVMMPNTHVPKPGPQKLNISI